MKKTCPFPGRWKRNPRRHGLTYARATVTDLAPNQFFRSCRA